MDNIEKQYQFFQYEGMRKSAYGIGYAELKEECDKYEEERKLFLANNRIYTDTFDKEETLRFICYYKVIDTVEKINKGVRIVNINWFSVVYRGNSFYDLKILCWVVNSFEDINVKIAIVNEVHRQLQLHLVTNENDRAQCFIEYLSTYKEMLISDSAYIPPTPQYSKQERIYSIPTDLSEQQLKALLERLKSNGFIAPEQTVEDFLNAFNPNATKQGKIKWIKRGETTKGVTKTAMVNFVYLMYPELYFDKDKYNIVAAVFDIEPTRSDLSRGKKSEFSNELQQIITY